MPKRNIKRALISVYDKTGIVDFARTLVSEFGIEVVSTGGTAALLTQEGVPVTLVEEVTGFPEMMSGRVKTLHPKIHAGILADRDNPDHMRQLEKQGIEPIDMVVVNLYPFEQTIADPDCSFEQAIEMIDIGGPCLLRASAKNHKHVLVIAEPELYPGVLRHLRDEETAEGPDIHRFGALSTFRKTAGYDSTIAGWLSALDSHDSGPRVRFLELSKAGPLRYGENPHQEAELLRYRDDLRHVDLTVADAGFGSEKQISHNNYLDANAAVDLC
ncbi:MAG: bifunctional phosphoribosylaminoimidazolecarboxamide formyltransferase/IMP cyclohydrolase, partial [Phycisphaerales bacterium]